MSNACMLCGKENNGIDFNKLDRGDCIEIDVCEDCYFTCAQCGDDFPIIAYRDGFWVPNFGGYRLCMNCFDLVLLNPKTGEIYKSQGSRKKKLDNYDRITPETRKRARDLLWCYDHEDSLLPS